MTQLVENKPPRRALIATLSHISTRRRRFVGRSFSSDITHDARSAYGCAASPAEGLAALWRAACVRPGIEVYSRLIQPLVSSPQPPEPNRNIPRLETNLTPAVSMSAPF